MKKPLQNAAAGTPETIRTSDPSLRRRMLYPLSYRGISDCPVILQWNLTLVKQGRDGKVDIFPGS